MNKAVKLNKVKRFSIVAATGALVAVPLLAGSVQAAPPSHAPAHGYYKNKDKNRDGNWQRGNGRGRDGGWRDRDRDDDRRGRGRDGDWRDRDRDGDWRDRNRDGGWRGRDRDRDDNWNDGNPVGDRGTMTATVIREVGGGRFEVRADDGRTFSVRSSASESRRVRTGDRVELVGYLTDRNSFVADSIRVIGRGDGGVNGNIEFYATVLSASSNRLTVRADDGQTFTVNTRSSYSSSINRGDRVRVSGYSTNRNVVSSATVELVSNNGGYGDNNDVVDFNGTVVSSNGRTLQVRGDNGRTYNVRINNNSEFRRGERVRITGTYRNGIVYATGVGRL